MTDDCGGGPGGTSPRGSAGELFALMLHDRLVELERQVAMLHLPDTDPAITLVDCPSGSPGVYVRVHAAAEVDLDAWAAALVKRLGTLWGRCVEASSCQHYGLDGTFVVECLVVATDHAGVNPDPRIVVSQTARAAMDAAVTDCGAQLADAAPRGERVLACGVLSREWFAESLSAANPLGKVWSWDPAETEAVADACTLWIKDDGWSMLQGWLAHNRERVDVQHPKALHAQIEARRLWAFVSRLS